VSAPLYSPRQRVTHQGRPAVILTRPAVGATGATLYGIRYTDGPTYEAVPSHPGMRKYASGSCAIAKEDDIREAS
jgi:hypothetical protein